MGLNDITSTENISVLIREMRNGSDQAATQLWTHYCERLLRVSKRRLTGLESRMADEEDVAITAFHSFVKRMRRGEYPRIEKRDEAWRLLVVIAVRKAINLVRDAKRKRRNPSLNTGKGKLCNGVENFEDKGADQPEALAMIADSVEHLLQSLTSDELREIAMAKVAGYTNREISDNLGRSIATIERRLNLI